MEIAKLLEEEKVQVIDFICKDLQMFKYTSKSTMLLEHSRMFVEQELMAFIKYLTIDNPEIPRVRGRENAAQEVECWIVSHLFYSLLEYVNKYNDISAATVIYFIKRYMLEFSISYNREMRDRVHQKLNKLTKALNIVIIQQQAELGNVQRNERYRKYNISDTEKNIITLVSEGKSNKEVAEVMLISEKTVMTHLRNIYSKCRLHSRIELFNLFKPE